MTKAGKPMEEKSADHNGSGAKLFPVCAICGQIPKKGIRGGIRLKKGFICSSCETEIVGLTTETYLYDQIKDKIKAIIK